MSKNKLKRQIQHLLDTTALEGFYSDGTTEMVLTLPGGADMEISILEDEEGYNFLALAISHPVDN